MKLAQRHQHQRRRLNIENKSILTKRSESLSALKMIRGSRSGYPLPLLFSSPSHPCEPDIKIKINHNKPQQHFQHYILTIAYRVTSARINKSIQVSIIIDNMLTGAGRGTTLFFSTSIVSAFRMSYLPMIFWANFTREKMARCTYASSSLSPL